MITTMIELSANPFLTRTKSVAKPNANVTSRKMPSTSSGGRRLSTRVSLLSLIVMILGVSVSDAFVSRTGGRKAQPNMFSTFQNDSPVETPQLALLTFDLDDTLFPIGPVVQDANDAMIRSMHRLGYTKSNNKSVLKHTTAIRKSIKYPITYTSLRMRAIQAELESHLPKKQSVDPSVVKHCFDAWLNERHFSAERNLFPGTVEMLESIKEQHPTACIAAITNGRGNPKDMESISRFFDFCVSGEDDGIFPERKPQRGIYEASLARYQESYPHTIGDGRIWCHVGDCLANDVGASVDCGAYGVWMEADHKDVTANSNQRPAWSTASKRTMRNRERLKRSAKKKVNAKITHLSELPSAIDALLEQATMEEQEAMSLRR